MLGIAGVAEQLLKVACTRAAQKVALSPMSRGLATESWTVVLTHGGWSTDWQRQDLKSMPPPESCPAAAHAGTQAKSHDFWPVMSAAVVTNTLFRHWQQQSRSRQLGVTTISVHSVSGSAGKFT